MFAQTGEAVEYGEEVAAVESDVSVETDGPADDGTGPDLGAETAAAGPRDTA